MGTWKRTEVGSTGEGRNVWTWERGDVEVWIGLDVIGEDSGWCVCLEG